MQYLGGKARQAKHLAEIICKVPARRYLEPFLGGGSIAERVAGAFPAAELSDAHPDLMLMWRALLDGWLPPERVTREQYRALRLAPASALRGFVGFGCSFGGKWFGGYASNRRGDDFAGAARSAVLRKAAAMRSAGAALSCRSYEDLAVGPGDLVYCDPPYTGTTGYGGIGAFDSARFWATVRRWADAGAAVLVSEYQAPQDVPCVWERVASRSLKATENGTLGGATERLYALGSRVDTPAGRG